MSSSKNINTGTITPTVINPDSIPVDLDLEEDLEQIQQEVAAKQRRIEEEAQAKVAAACECNEKKCQEWKAKEEEEQKWKEEEDKAMREKALEEAQKWQLLVSCQLLLLSETDLFQTLKKQREVWKAQMVDVDGVSTGTWFLASRTDLYFDSCCKTSRHLQRHLQRQGCQRGRCMLKVS